MGHKLFGRAYRVTIGPNGGTGRVWSNFDPLALTAVPGLRLRFRAHKTGDSTPNRLQLGIYNLSKDARHYIENGGKGFVVQLEAGYLSEAANMPVTFVGGLDLASSHTRGQHIHHHQGADWLTEIEARDGGKAARSTTISKSFGPKASEASVIRYLASSLGVTVGKLSGLSKAQFNHGRSLSGSARYELDRLCRTRGLRWSIQDGVLHVLPVGQAIDSTSFLLTQATGMIGSPEKTERGIKVVSLLQGAITPGRLIEVKSADINGTFVVEDVVHEGDTHDHDWFSTIEAIPLAGL